MVGPAPFYRGLAPQAAPSTDGRPIHDWNTSDTSFAPGGFDAHRPPSHRRSITDVCGLSGMTGINATTLAVTRDPVMGTVQGGTAWKLGAADLRGPWTFAVNVKVSGATGNLTSVFDNAAYGLGRDGPITRIQGRGVFAATGTRTIGIRTDDRTVLDLGYSMPANTWTKLVFVNDGARTTLYVNGAPVGAVDAAPDLALGRLGGPGVTLQSAQVYAQALDPAEIARQASTAVPAIPAAHCRAIAPAPVLPTLPTLVDFTPVPTEEPTTPAPTAVPTDPTTTEPTTVGGTPGDTTTGAGTPSGTAATGVSGHASGTSTAGADDATAAAPRSTVRLPRTETEIAPLVVLAVGLVVAGLGAVLVARRRRR